MFSVVVVVAVVVLQLLVAQLAAQTDCGLCAPHYPRYGVNHLVTYTESMGKDEFLAHPDKTSSNLDKEYFVNEFNFDDAPFGTFFIGARNKLYEFNESTLLVTKTFSWDAISTDVSSCNGIASDREVACSNHIRLYRKLKFADSADRLMVCGTGAYNVTCRTVKLSDISDSDEVGPATPKLDIGVISLHPLIPFAGDFLDDPFNGYQTTGYTESAELNTYDFARYPVSYNNDSKEIEFTSTPSRTIQTTNDFHIREPYLPVKLVKQDFDGTNKYKMFYFFIRERKYYPLVSDAVPVRSRIIRVCQNDTGLDIMTNNLFFKTYLKAEILCFGKALNTPRGVGAQEHFYTVLRDVVITESMSRWYDNDQIWFKMVYGVFTTDVYGPNGTAICVYHAQFGSGILQIENRGIVDVFGLNKYNDEQGDTEAGDFLNCDSANARADNKGDHIIAVDPVKPFYGLKLPLVEMQGEVIKKIQTQQVCVRRHNDPSKCVMQDVLFVGTEKGRVKKISFSTVTGSQSPELNDLSHDAIISQEWELADESSVEQMTLKDDYLFVTTYTRIYKFPVADCGRHLNCKYCVGSRDPHCYWNTTSCVCERNNLGGSEQKAYDFPSSVLQNIHTGEATECDSKPECSVDVTATSASTFEIMGLESCNYSTSYSVTVEPYDLCEAQTITSKINESNLVVTDSAILGRRLYNVTFTASGDNGDSSYYFLRKTLNGAPVAPTDSEVFARAVNSTHVEVTVSLEGCNIHDELGDYMICVQFNDSSKETCQQYNGVNSFMSGPYKGCESIDYIVSAETSYGKASMLTASTVTTRASAVGAPTNLMIDERNSSSLTLQWRSSVDSSFCNTTGYSVKVNGIKRSDCSTTNTEYTLTGLFSYTNYTLSVTACSEGDETESEAIVETTECEKPFPVRNLQLLDAYSDTLSFVWDPPLYVNGTNLMYNVYEECYKKTSLTVENFTDITPDTSHMIVNLDPVTRCCLGVSAVTYCGGRGWVSNNRMSCGITVDDIPGPVENLTVNAISPYTLFVYWSLPNNYSNPGLRYEIKWEKLGHVYIDSDMVIDQLYYFITDLEENTLYRVTVTGVNDIGYGSSVAENETTLSGVPSPPHDVDITFSGCDMTVRWEHSDKNSVTQYVVRAQCNREMYNGTVDSSMFSYTFNICDGDPNSYLAWCSAQVQANNSIGFSGFSNFVEEVFPQIPPSEPDIFIADDRGSSVAISFTVTAPYALDSLTVNFSLFSAVSSITNNHTFTGDNVLKFSGLIRTQTYTFSLMLCDSDAGCSDPSTIMFKPSQIPPKPPSNIVVGNILYNSFELNWDHPAGENISVLCYHIHVILEDGQPQNYYTPNTSVTVTNLTAETTYYYLVRAMDTAANLTGQFSNSEEVTTVSGTLNPPENFEAIFINRSRLRLFWDTPSRNGTILWYIIVWLPSVGDNCEAIAMRATQNEMYRNISSNENSVTIVDPQGFDNLIEGQTVTICMRSVNSGSFSGWISTNVVINNQVVSTIEPVLQNDESSIGYLSGTVALAIVAIVIGIVLALVLAYAIYKRKSKSDDHTDCETGGDKSDTSLNNYEQSTPKKFNGKKTKRTPERMESTRSTAPMINGRNE